MHGSAEPCVTLRTLPSDKLTEKVPFLTEAKVKELGCEYVPGEARSETAVRYGKLVTGWKSGKACASRNLLRRACCVQS